MSKGVFDQSIDQMLEFDKELDINSVLDSIPAIESDIESKKVEDETKKDDKKLSLENINKVLDSKIAETQEEIKQIEKVVDDKTKKTVEVEEDKKDDDAPGTNEQTTETSSDAPFTVIFAKDLVDQGLLSSFNEKEFLDEIKEVGEAAALRNLIKTEIELNTTAIKQDLDAGYQDFLALTGKGIPAETAGTLVDLKKQFDTIKPDELTKEENAELRKKVLTDYYRLTTSMSDAKINKTVQSSIDLGDDVDDSKEFLAELKTLINDQITAEEKAAEEQMTLRKEENRRVLESLKENINTIEEVIPGVGINKQTKVKMYESLTKEVQDNKGRITNAVWAKRAEDPIFFDSRLAYLLETGFFEKGKAWNKAAQAKTTKEISVLEKELKNRSQTSSSTGAPAIRSPEQDKTTKDNIESMRGIFTR